MGGRQKVVNPVPAVHGSDRREKEGRCSGVPDLMQKSLRGVIFSDFDVFFMGKLLNHVESLAICSDKCAKPVLLMFFCRWGIIIP